MNQEDGYCVKIALSEFGYDLDLPELVKKDEFPKLADQSGLKYYGFGDTYRVKVDVPVIVIHTTDDPNVDHAVCTTLGEFTKDHSLEQVSGLFTKGE